MRISDWSSDVCSSDLRPKNLGDLHGVLRIVKDSAPVEKLRNLQASRYPQLKWDETNEDVAEELLYQVSQGTLDYTIVNSDLLQINQRYYPNLRTAFTVSDALNVAWAFRRGQDTSLDRKSTRLNYSN